MNMVERKCPNCGTWNKDNDYCTQCHTTISPILIEEEREKEREIRRNNIPPTKLDRFVDGWKNHPFFLLRWLYYLLYSIGFTFIAIASFFAWLAASPNG